MPQYLSAKPPPVPAQHQVPRRTSGNEAEAASSNTTQFGWNKMPFQVICICCSRLVRLVVSLVGSLHTSDSRASPGNRSTSRSVASRTLFRIANTLSSSPRQEASQGDESFETTTAGRGSPGCSEKLARTCHIALGICCPACCGCCCPGCTTAGSGLHDTSKQLGGPAHDEKRSPDSGHHGKT